MDHLKSQFACNSSEEMCDRHIHLFRASLPHSSGTLVHKKSMLTQLTPQNPMPEKIQQCPRYLHTSNQQSQHSSDFLLVPGLYCSLYWVHSSVVLIVSEDSLSLSFFFFVGRVMHPNYSDASVPDKRNFLSLLNEFHSLYLFLY